MKLPLPFKITPDPLVTTPFEIRFITRANEKNLFSKLLPLFLPDLPTFEKLNQIPLEIKKTNPQLRYQPDYQLRNDDYAVSFGDESFLIEILGPYPLWENYFSFIKKQVSKLLEQDILQSIIRIGLRFGNIFINSDLSQILQYSPKLALPDYTETTILNRVDLKKGDINLQIQLSDNATFERLGKIVNGAFIDIDASYSLPLEPNDYIFSIIDDLHTAEKELFYQILKPEFVTTLHPEYKNN